MYASALSQSDLNLSDLARRISRPTPEAAQARAALKRQRACRQAQRKLAGMQQRLMAFRHDLRDLAALTEVAEAAAPNRIDKAAWPSDVQELADKIERGNQRGLWPTEAPVRNKDRQIIKRMLPPGVQVQMNDPR